MDVLAAPSTEETPGSPARRPSRREIKHYWVEGPQPAAGRAAVGTLPALAAVLGPILPFRNDKTLSTGFWFVFYVVSKEFIRDRAMHWYPPKPGTPSVSHGNPAGSRDHGHGAPGKARPAGGAGSPKPGPGFTPAESGRPDRRRLGAVRWHGVLWRRGERGGADGAAPGVPPGPPKRCRRPVT